MNSVCYEYDFKGVFILRKLYLPIVFIGILSLFACQSNQNVLIFSGEGENWSAELTINQIVGETYQIQMNYKGNNIEDIKVFRYNVESQNGVVDYSENDAKLNEEGIFKRNLLSENSPSTSVEDEIVIKIEWNDISETFLLVNE